MRIMPFLPPRSGLLATIFILFTSSLSAQTFGQIGERAQGMGGAFVAVADDASAIYWNPAGLATGAYFDAQLGFSRQSKTADEQTPARITFAGAAMPALALGYYLLHTGVSSSGSRQNEGSGELPLADLTTGNFGVSFVQTVVETLVIGSTLRVVKGPDKSVFDLDAGAMVSVGNLRIGLMARNLRQAGFVVPERPDPIVLKRQARMGVGFHGPFSLAFDVDLTKTPAPFGDSRRAAVGSEQWWATGRVGTRFGVQWSTLEAARPALSGGLTVRLPHSSQAEGHVTKGKKLRESGWGAGLRVTF